MQLQLSPAILTPAYVCPRRSRAMELAIDWNALLKNLEGEVVDICKERTRGSRLLQKAKVALGQAEQASAREDVINRLDMMLLVLTEATKENVCTNIKCPHYSEKCKMR